MRRPATVIALLVVLTLAPPVTFAAAGPAGPSAVAQHTADGRLSVGDSSVTGLAKPGVALTDAVSDQYGFMEVRYRRYTTQHAIETSPNASERLALYRRAIDEIAERTRSLEASRRATRVGLANESLSATTAIRRLGHVALQAEALTGALLAIRGTASSANLSGADPATLERLNNRTRELDARLDDLTGPVGLRIGEATAGHRDPTPVFIAASDVGLALSTVDGTTYLREVYRPDRRDAAEGSVDLDAARELVAERYPSIWNASEGHTRRLLALPGGAVLANLGYPGGQVEAAIDVTNGAIYRERRVLNLSQYSPGPARVRSQSGYVLRVNRTFAGGPLRVALADDSGVPVDGRVTVEGRFVGRTGPDGELWTVAPGGRGDDRIILTAEIDGVQVPISVELLDEG